MSEKEQHLVDLPARLNLKPATINRKDFLRLAGAATGVALLSACSVPLPSMSQPKATGIDILPTPTIDIPTPAPTTEPFKDEPRLTHEEIQQVAAELESNAFDAVSKRQTHFAIELMQGSRQPSELSRYATGPLHMIRLPPSDNRGKLGSQIAKLSETRFIRYKQTDQNVNLPTDRIPLYEKIHFSIYLPIENDKYNQLSPLGRTMVVMKEFTTLAAFDGYAKYYYHILTTQPRKFDFNLIDEKGNVIPQLEWDEATKMDVGLFFFIVNTFVNTPPDNQNQDTHWRLYDFSGHIEQAIYYAILSKSGHSIKGIPDSITETAFEADKGKIGKDSFLQFAYNNLYLPVVEKEDPPWVDAEAMAEFLETPGVVEEILRISDLLYPK